MKAFRINPGQTSERIIVIFGGGLIGSAISKSLLKMAASEIYYIPSHWTDSQSFNLKISTFLRKQDSKSLAHIDWIWAAGKCGFYATPSETEDELNFFDDALQYIDGLRTRFEISKWRFHYISSAGGLFEGQHVTPTSNPTPMRPYGFLKLKQEELVKSYFPDAYVIYRPSTVYGSPVRGHRVGLIANLFMNLYRNQVTIINGDYQTLRDYVWVEDVSEFVVRKVLQNVNDAQSHFLVSAKPTSIYELIEMVQRISNSPVLYAFNSLNSNSESIIFSQALLPAGWINTSLLEGIRKVKYHVY